MRALRKRLACACGLCEPFSLVCAWESIASIPIPRGSLSFFLWHQRKKDDFKAIFNMSHYPRRFLRTVIEELEMALFRLFQICNCVRFAVVLQQRQPRGGVLKTTGRSLMIKLSSVAQSMVSKTDVCSQYAF